LGLEDLLLFFVLAPASVTVRVQQQAGLNQKAPALYSAAVFSKPRPAAWSRGVPTSGIYRM
jgi:hypothetical protein